MQTLPMFADVVDGAPADGLPSDGPVMAAPPTEGIKYAGSKLKILPYILRLARRVGVQTALDGFSGTTRVSQALAKIGCSVICNDVAVWSEVFGNCYLRCRKTAQDYRPLIEHLNALPPVDGWFTQHYGGQPNGGCAVQPDGRKKPWQAHNTRKLDAIRQEIENLRLDPIDEAVALTSLMLALDRVDSTLGHYAAYLKDWSPRSYGSLRLKAPALFASPGAHQVHRRDIFELIADMPPVDLAYFDPPYGSNNAKMPPSRVRYSAYYHIWQSVCRFDRPPLFGKANRRRDTSDTIAASDFEDFRRSASGRFAAVETLDRLIAATPSHWIMLSYSSGGRATAEELDALLRANGRLAEVIAIDYQRNVMAQMAWTHQWVNESAQPNREFVFLLEK